MIYMTYYDIIIIIRYIYTIKSAYINITFNDIFQIYFLDLHVYLRVNAIEYRTYLDTDVIICISRMANTLSLIIAIAIGMHSWSLLKYKLIYVYYTIYRCNE